MYLIPTFFSTLILLKINNDDLEENMKYQFWKTKVVLFNKSDYGYMLTWLK